MTEANFSEKPDIRCVSSPQWVDAHEAGASPVISDTYSNLPLPMSTWNSLRMAAQAGALHGEEEVCGFITSRFELYWITNRHLDPRNNFVMDQGEVSRCIETLSAANESIIGVFHTHPSGAHRPSDGDILGWPNRDLGWRYFIATASDVWEYRYLNQPIHNSHMAGIPTLR